jgi:hypothetical protein
LPSFPAPPPPDLPPEPEVSIQNVTTSIKTDFVWAVTSTAEPPVPPPLPYTSTVNVSHSVDFTRSPGPTVQRLVQGRIQVRNPSPTRSITLNGVSVVVPDRTRPTPREVNATCDDTIGGVNVFSVLPASASYCSFSVQLPTDASGTVVASVRLATAGDAPATTSAPASFSFAGASTADSRGTCATVSESQIPASAGAFLEPARRVSGQKPPSAAAGGVQLCDSSSYKYVLQYGPFSSSDCGQRKSVATATAAPTSGPQAPVSANATVTFTINGCPGGASPTPPPPARLRSVSAGGGGGSGAPLVPESGLARLFGRGGGGRSEEATAVGEMDPVAEQVLEGGVFRAFFGGGGGGGARAGGGGGAAVPGRRRPRVRGGGGGGGQEEKPAATAEGAAGEQQQQQQEPRLLPESGAKPPSAPQPTPRPTTPRARRSDAAEGAAPSSSSSSSKPSPSSSDALPPLGPAQSLALGAEGVRALLVRRWAWKVEQRRIGPAALAGGAAGGSGGGGNGDGGPAASSASPSSALAVAAPITVVRGQAADVALSVVASRSLVPPPKAPPGALLLLPEKGGGGGGGGSGGAASAPATPPQPTKEAERWARYSSYTVQGVAVVSNMGDRPVRLESLEVLVSVPGDGQAGARVAEVECPAAAASSSGGGGGSGGSGLGGGAILSSSSLVVPPSGPGSGGQPLRCPFRVEGLPVDPSTGVQGGGEAHAVVLARAAAADGGGGGGAGAAVTGGAASGQVDFALPSAAQGRWLLEQQQQRFKQQGGAAAAKEAAVAPAPRLPPLTAGTCAGVSGGWRLLPGRGDPSTPATAVASIPVTQPTLASGTPPPPRVCGQTTNSTFVLRLPPLYRCGAYTLASDVALAPEAPAGGQSGASATTASTPPKTRLQVPVMVTGC